MKILLVDDLDANLQLLEMVLGSQGHGTVRALNGQEALAQARQEPPDLVIADILMPVMDGYALCRAWVEDLALRGIPFIFYTATYLSEEDEAFALSLGAAAFLRKPMEPEPFLAEVRKVLDRAQAGGASPWDGVPPDEGTFLKLYNERLVHKLDQRTQVLARQVDDLRQTESRLRLKSVALEAAANAIMITDRQGAIEWVNPAFLTTLGFAAEEVLGRNPRILNSGTHDAAFFRRLWDTVQAGQVWRGEVVNRNRQGALLTFQVAITPLRDETGAITHFIDIMQDISEQKRMEGELRQSQKMEAVGRLAGSVAHDFNNMLNVILINAELSLQSADLTPSQRSLSQDIKLAAERSAELTRQLLAFSRKQPTQPRCVDLNQVVREHWQMLLRMVEGDLELAFRPDPALKTVYMDPSQITQVLTNLVINARDALPGAGTIRIETANVQVEAAREALTPGQYVRLTVSDTGTGMDARTLERIFEPFFTTKGEGRGTGLGLSTVYGIVKQNRGGIEVDSNLGLGTSMKIYLPVCQEAEGAPELDLEGTPPGGAETILVAEAEQPMRDVLRAALEGLGYTVLAAVSPLDTVLLDSQHPGPIHLLITEVVMPGVNGKDLQAHLGRVRPGLKVLFISGYPGEILVGRGLMGAETPFLQKPFRRLELARKVREVLDTSRE